MKTILKITLLAVIIIAFASCRKAGAGGDATIVAFLQHHGHTIVNHVGYADTVYVKFNATESPGINPSNYDTYFIGEVGEDHVHCEKLKAGKYFLYGAGLDSSIAQRVTGGMAVQIKYSERKQEKDVDLAVTE